MNLEQIKALHNDMCEQTTSNRIHALYKRAEALHNDMCAQITFNRVHDFVMNDDNDLHERAEALRFVTRDVMGDDRVCDDDERIVNEYIECM